jgi:Kef-type K+ transport system membrane component KefB
MLKKATWVALISCFAFALIGYAFGIYLGFSSDEATIIGAAMMFSSTIIGLKLLPTNVLHHQHTGEVMISILLLQDLLAIIVLLWLHSASMDGFGLTDIGSVILSLPTLLLFAFLFERYVLMYLFNRFDRIREYLFLIAIAWCLSVSEIAQMIKLSHEVGAFVAGISIAISPISLYIAESLEPVRDFFLVMFFFSVGASFNLHYLPSVALPAIILAGIMLIIKPKMITRHGSIDISHRDRKHFNLTHGHFFRQIDAHSTTKHNKIEQGISP